MMEARTKWLLAQPSWWVGLAVTAIATCLATGIIPAGIGIKIASAFIAICNQYGISAGHMKEPPRVPLAMMSANERQKLFDENPGLEQRFYAAHPEFSEIKLPPALPPPPPTGG